MRAREILSEWPVANYSACSIDFSSSSPTVQFAGATRQNFALASLSKPITALAVLVGVQEEIIDLDARFESGFNRSDLLSHQSGLKFDVDGGISIQNCRDAMLNPNSYTFDRPGNQRRIYSNLGYELLAFDLEIQSQMPFHDYLREAILDPVRMTESFIDLGAHGLGYPFGASAGIVSSANDMSLFLAELINGHVVDQSFKDPAFVSRGEKLPGIVPGFGYFEDNAWGMGFEVKASKNRHWTGTLNSSSTFGHFGRSGTFFWVDPIEQLACCVLTDRPFDDFAKESWPIFSDLLLQDRLL